MREVLRWCVRQPRVWASVAAAAVASALAADDGRNGWTGFVAVTSGVLAVLSIREKYVTDHPHRASRKAARHQERVDAILWRYEREAAARRRDEGRR